ncbi:hypothetical protein BDV28DRAFT_138401 [Aspergillus coremiiformis]|uniref:Uncharacterized protein n=1 Tax=Aspergillus coremiiformis TaxID=138285 RepID=A0A5N6Z281_9EURO|nr:hypothetical protein BDV28DRAFT_138401 [Aspergillus coremiiformis]
MICVNTQGKPLVDPVSIHGQRAMSNEQSSIAQEIISQLDKYAHTVLERHRPKVPTEPTKFSYFRIHGRSTPCEKPRLQEVGAVLTERRHLIRFQRSQNGRSHGRSFGLSPPGNDCFRRQSSPRQKPNPGPETRWLLKPMGQVSVDRVDLYLLCLF